jgi:FkbM family methyltransferase
LPAALTEEDVYLAIPLQRRQISCRELMRREVLLQECAADAPIMIDMIDSPYAHHDQLKKIIQERGIAVERRVLPAREERCGPDQGQDLERLLAEDYGSVCARERAFARLLEAEDAPPLVLFGAGILGRRTAAELRRRAVTCAAFSDNNSAMWDKQAQGLPVLSPEEAVKRFGGRGVFVVTVWEDPARHRLADTQRQLRALGCADVRSFSELLWSYPERLLPYRGIDLPSRLLAARDRIREAGAIWADATSRQEYVSEVRWQLSGDPGDPHAAVQHEQYFARDLFAFTEDDVIADCGAFDGDTIRCLVERLRLSFREIHALEPDPASFAALEQYVERLPPPVRQRIVLHQLAVAGQRGAARFTANGKPSARLSEDGQAVVECAPLDEVLAEAPPTFIKMDIEGAEMEALRGAECLIRANRPILAICVYHRQADLWDIPLLLRSLCDDYSFFLRAHEVEGFDLVCYAVPRERLLLQSA